MATKKSKPAAVKSSTSKAILPHTEPSFPYTNKPGSLRRFLQLVPQKPRPQKIDKTLMQSWGFKDTNDMSILRVLRSAGLLSSTNEPTDLYTSFMNLNGGAAALAKPLRELYAPLFTASHTPYKESAEMLRNLFNIHSGGSAVTLDLQVQTFKALSESTNFESGQLQDTTAGQPTGGTPPAAGSTPPNGFQQGPSVHIDLHIHLPENKSRRDYEAIIEDIGRYIYGRAASGVADE